MALIMKVRKTIRDAIWTKRWSTEQVHKYVGNFRKCYFTYATDSELREGAASGGSVTGLLSHLLTNRAIDGALVCATDVKDNHVNPVFTIATSLEELKAAQGSKYSAVFFSQHALPLIKQFSGRLAVVALPCDAKILHRYRQLNPGVDEKIALVISLFCGHNSRPELTDQTVEELRLPGEALISFRYREGHWRGNLQAKFDSGREVEKPFSFFSDYQNLYFYSQAKCHHCFDHVGYYADISAGDIWSPRMRDEPIKHTALVTRSDHGDAIVRTAISDGALQGREEPIAEVLDGQARTLPFHYNVTSRAIVGRLFGMEILARTEERVSLPELLVALLALLNDRVSRSPIGQKLIFWIPRPLIRLYLLILKGLESL
jgi:coenzyme F420-reducing hydrogenase beta subunit